VSDQYGPPGPNAPGPGDDQFAGGWSQPGAPPATSGYGQQNVPGYGYPPPPAPAGYPNGYPVAQQNNPQPVPYAMGPAGPPLRNDYARWGRRVGSALVDQAPSIVGTVVFNVGYVYWLIGVSQSGATPDFSVGVVPMIVGAGLLLIGFGWTIYNRWVVAGRTGQSLGRRVTKIMLVSEETSLPIGGVNAFLRDLVHILDGIAYVGYLWPHRGRDRSPAAVSLRRSDSSTVRPGSRPGWITAEPRTARSRRGIRCW
jgi:uncharacterized RDD family membrane protein YckC